MDTAEVPEGDIVYRAARRMNAALAGRELTTFDLRWPSLATADRTGAQVLEVVSAGKHMLTRMSAVGGHPPSTLHTHFRMEGTWRVHRTGERAKPASPNVRAVVGNGEWTAVGERLGMLDLVPTVEEHRLVGHLGPDVLGPDWDPAAVRRTLLEQPDRTIGEGLLDQRVLAGVGTFFMAEALFLRGITPWTPVGDVTDLDAVLQLEHRLLSANAARAVQSTTGDLRPGQTQWVHSRSGRPCRRCGTTVRVAMIGPAPQDRTAFYCPRCQRGPAPSDDGRPQQPLGTQPTRLRRSPYRR